MMCVSVSQRVTTDVITKARSIKDLYLLSPSGEPQRRLRPAAGERGTLFATLISPSA